MSRFTVVRAWHSYGAPDTACPGTVAAAWAGGMKHVDVYMFPCPSCGDAAGQISKLKAFLDSHSVKFGMLWLDIEGPQYWGSQSSNQAFLNDLVAAAKHRFHVGIYSSASQWNSIFGSSYGPFGSLPIWYAHYDHLATFSDFKPFGGWHTPAIKQFSDQGAKCGASYDINFYPS